MLTLTIWLRKCLRFSTIKYCWQFPVSQIVCISGVVEDSSWQIEDSILTSLTSWPLLENWKVLEWFKASRGRSGISRPLGRFPQVLFLDQQRFSLQGRTCWVSVHSLRSLLTSAAEFWLKWVNPQWRKLKSVPLKKEKIGIKHIHKLYWWLVLWNHRRKSEDAPSNGENS